VKLARLLDPRLALRRAAARARKGSNGNNKKKINLALQGGGAHGAFTWGVIDQILDDGRLTVEGISGASAGAVNAVMLADGLARGGPEEAKKRLADFWRAASLGGDLPPLQRAVVERLFSFLPLEGSPMQAWFDALSRYLSPYDLNPLRINPLKDLIERFVDFEAVRSCSHVALFVSATNVHTGRLRIFPRDKITADVIMASACLPFLFRAVEVDGEPYWDGGYLANPAIFPFFSATESEDVLIVQINPLERQEVPTSSKDIMNRVNEITFNSSLMAEFRAIDFVDRLIDQGRLTRGTGAGQYRRINAHRIVLDRMGKNLDSDTKLSTDYDFFEMLRQSGKRAARRFLDAHFDDIGVRSTFDLRAEAHAEWA
jgi:NTE family protein